MRLSAVHNTYEVDGSVAYTDSAFTSDGNTNHFNSSKWAESLGIAVNNGNQFGQAWLAGMVFHVHEIRFTKWIISSGSIPALSGLCCHQ